jgi:hypothetical protein
MPRFRTTIPGFFLDPDTKVTIRRRPDEKHVTIRVAAQLISTPMETVYRELEKSGTFQNERFIISTIIPKDT